MGVLGEAADADAIGRTGNAVVARQRALKSPFAVMKISIVCEKTVCERYLRVCEGRRTWTRARPSIKGGLLSG